MSPSCTLILVNRTLLISNPQNHIRTWHSVMFPPQKPCSQFKHQFAIYQDHIYLPKLGTDYWLRRAAGAGGLISRGSKDPCIGPSPFCNQPVNRLNSCVCQPYFLENCRTVLVPLWLRGNFLQPLEAASQPLPSTIAIAKNMKRGKAGSGREGGRDDESALQIQGPLISSASSKRVNRVAKLALFWADLLSPSKCLIQRAFKHWVRLQLYDNLVEFPPFTL